MGELKNYTHTHMRKQESIFKDELWGHYAEWKNPDRERQIYGIIYTWNLTKKSNTEQSRKWLPGARRWGKYKKIGKRIRWIGYYEDIM